MARHPLGRGPAHGPGGWLRLTVARTVPARRPYARAHNAHYGMWLADVFRCRAGRDPPAHGDPIGTPYPSRLVGRSGQALPWTLGRGSWIRALPGASVTLTTGSRPPLPRGGGP